MSFPVVHSREPFMTFTHVQRPTKLRGIDASASSLGGSGGTPGHTPMSSSGGAMTMMMQATAELDGSADGRNPVPSLAKGQKQRQRQRANAFRNGHFTRIHDIPYIRTCVYTLELKQRARSPPRRRRWCPRSSRRFAAGASVRPSVRPGIASTTTTQSPNQNTHTHAPSPPHTLTKQQTQGC